MHPQKKSRRLCRRPPGIADQVREEAAERTRVKVYRGVFVPTRCCRRESRDTKCAHHGMAPGAPGMRIERGSASAMGPYAQVFCRPIWCPASSSCIEDERLDRHNKEVWRIFLHIVDDWKDSALISKVIDKDCNRILGVLYTRLRNVCAMENCCGKATSAKSGGVVDFHFWQWHHLPSTHQVARCLATAKTLSVLSFLHSYTLFHFAPS